MKRKYAGFIVSVETFRIEFDLQTWATNRDNMNKFGIAYTAEDVIASGFDDLVLYGVRKSTAQRLVKELVKLGVPKDQISLNAITRIG